MCFGKTATLPCQLALCYSMHSKLFCYHHCIVNESFEGMGFFPLYLAEYGLTKITADYFT